MVLWNKENLWIGSPPVSGGEVIREFGTAIVVPSSSEDSWALSIFFNELGLGWGDLVDDDPPWLMRK